MTVPPRLALERLSHRFGERLAVDALDLDIAEGEVVCLLGPSGCGKTTTLRLAAGLERVQEGRIRIAGQVVAGAGRALPPERRHVGLMFQDYALFPHLSVIENVAFGLSGRSDGRLDRARAALAKVGLAGRADAFPHMLSGGEQQRVALARALAPGPQVMLMDEPFSGLDIRLRDQVRDDTLALLEAAGTAVLLVTHDPEEAMRMANRIALMRAGRIVQLGPPAALYDHPVDAGAARFFAEASAIPATVRGGRVDSPFGPLAAPTLADGAAAEILIRPHALRLVDRGGAEARVTRCRRLGPDSLIDLELGGGLALSLRAPVLALEPGEMVSLGLDPAQVFVFPAVNG